LFRLDKDRAIVNRMGFNSVGLDVVSERLARRHGRPGIVGLNLGMNRDGAAAADYEEGIRRASGLAHYIVVNISSPNTPGLRELQRRTALAALLDRLRRRRDETAPGMPLLVKIAPDLATGEREDIAEVALAIGIDGLIVSNTTVARAAELRSRNSRETGGLSGKPLFAPSTALLADMYRLTKGRLPLVGVGGIASAADAYAKIRAGASLLQLYTALVFSGPALIEQIKIGLANLLRRDGFASIAAAVGTEAAVERARRPGQNPTTPFLLTPASARTTIGNLPSGGRAEA
jgi:dihydroorotate dehydrogenase